jgi:hypothetical protein
MATVAELRQNIIDLLNDAALNPTKYTDYRIGNKTFKPSQLIKHFTEQLELLNTMEEGDIDWVTFDINCVNTFGQELCEYEL